MRIVKELRRQDGWRHNDQAGILVNDRTGEWAEVELQRDSEGEAEIGSDLVVLRTAGFRVYGPGEERVTASEE